MLRSNTGARPSPCNNVQLGRIGANALRTILHLAVLLTILASSAFGQAAHSGGAAQRYEIIELPLRATAISDSEWVAGTVDDQHAATWSRKSGLSRIVLPQEFTFSECASINSHGDAVGTASTGDYRRRTGFVVRGSKVSLLPGEQSRANSINDAGTIVGQAIAPGAKAAGPVLWKEGSLTDLKICCSGSAKSVNQLDTVAGDTYDKQGRYHAFTWDSEHGARTISVPGEQYSSALGVNSRGDVLLKATPGGLFLYSAGQFHSIEITKATPRSMNNDGVLVGSFGTNPELQRAFVWDKAGGMRDLNTLIPDDSDWTLEVASSINDRGEIVGWGDHNGSDNTGFLLRPTAAKVKSHAQDRHGAKQK